MAFTICLPSIIRPSVPVRNTESSLVQKQHQPGSPSSWNTQKEARYCALWTSHISQWAGRRSRWSENQHWDFKMKVSDLKEFTSQEPWAACFPYSQTIPLNGHIYLCDFMQWAPWSSVMWDHISQYEQHRLKRIEQVVFLFKCNVYVAGNRNSPMRSINFILHQTQRFPRHRPRRLWFPLFVYSLCSFPSFFGSLCLLPIKRSSQSPECPRAKFLMSCVWDFADNGVFLFIYLYFVREDVMGRSQQH